MSGARGLISLLLALAGLVACSGQEKAVIPVGESRAGQQQAILRNKVAALLEKKNYRRAIELMTDGHQPGSPPARMGREYVAAINGLAAAGEESLSRGDYAVAGQSFKLALESYPTEPSLRERMMRDPKQLKKQMDTCSNRLMEQGLMEYRRGNMENAIRKWKELVAFDPGHHEAKKALETATAQLRALQKMERPPAK